MSQDVITSTTSASKLLQLIAASKARLQQLSTPEIMQSGSFSITRLPGEVVRKSMAFAEPADIARLDCCCRYFRGLTESVAHEQAREVYGRRSLPRRRAESWSSLLNFVALSLRAPTVAAGEFHTMFCLLYTSPSPRDLSTSRMPSSA